MKDSTFIFGTLLNFMIILKFSFKNELKGCNSINHWLFDGQCEIVEKTWRFIDFVEWCLFMQILWHIFKIFPQISHALNLFWKFWERRFGLSSALGLLCWFFWFYLLNHIGAHHLLSFYAVVTKFYSVIELSIIP